MRSALRAGEPLPPWRLRVTQDASDAWTRMLGDPNPIHRDARVVAALGLGDRPINPGPANLAYFYEMLRTRFPDAETRSLRARLTGNVYVGDVVEVTGEIVAVERGESRTVVRCALTLRGAPGAPPAAVATAEVLLPVSPGVEW